jgi:acyl-CoA reductase-like NAD-dependent aldehyde dehydrogenase/gamma-glutamyl-gamma-aminobutyrate hydrolase PuuD
MKRRIGISYSELSFEHYWKWFTAADLQDDLELVLLSFEKNNVEDIRSCDGFILTGGVDVHPSLYKGMENYPNQTDPLLPQRDLFEAKIYAHSQMHGLPLLGICRGLQLVNVLQGGKLIQDLGDRNREHRKVAGNDNQHTVTIVRDTALEGAIGSGKATVNSAHHQAALPESLGKDLRANAWSPDGILEGLEFKNSRNQSFMLCVQWHPERMEDNSRNPASENIKQAFLNAVRNSNMKKLTIINPATEEPVAELTEDTLESVTIKYERLKNGQLAWQQKSLAERVAVLQGFAGLLMENSEILAATLTSEMGKPLQQAKNEINGACTRISWLTGNAGKYLGDETMTNEEGLQERISYEALGVICNISAWNYPYLVGVNVFVPALLGGNSVLYKPSEYATLTGLQIEKYLKRAGVPEDVFATAIGGKEVGEQLLDLPFDGYFFTGSYKTGKYIYERVAPKMVPCQCELGGKDPLYVADDIGDIKAVAAATADGAFYNNGQSCCAVERIYVHQHVYDKYLDEFLAEVRTFKTGLPTEEGVYIGPLSRKDQLHILEKQVAEAKEKGAMVLAGGKRTEGKGFYFQPTVVTGVNHEMSLMKEESFGPVIGIMKVENDQEAVRLMNDTDYGLTASVYSASKERAEAIFAQMNTGTVYWNCCDRVSAALPWSGRKHSGFGATLSHAGLRAFVRPKAYHLRLA